MGNARIAEVRCLLSNISERKRAEDELRAARQQAEAANQAKAVFLANMSHEIRTPMSAILGLGHLLRRSGATPEQARFLDRIDSAGKHLLAILGDVLDLSKIEFGRLRLENIDFHLPSLFDEVHSILGESARSKNLRFEFDYALAPAWLRGDPTRLLQALLNYTSNAVKFTVAGRVTIRAAVLEQSEDSVLLRFSVEDTGPGIPQHHQPRLFEAFEQADPAITRKFGGSGLGLAITRQLANLMGGDAGADSEPGVGSTFGSPPACSAVRVSSWPPKMRLKASCGDATAARGFCSPRTVRSIASSP